MTLRKATLLLIGISSLVLFGILFGVTRQVIKTSFLSLESQVGHRDMERIQNAMADELEKLDAILTDWAVWDDAYSFLRAPGREFVESNMNDRTLASLRLAAIIFLDREGRVVWERGFNPGLGLQAPVPEGLHGWLDPRYGISRPASFAARKRGFVLLPQGPMLLASCPILPSNGAGPPAGTLVMCRPFTDMDLSAISERLKLRTVLRRADAPLPPELVPLSPASLKPGEVNTAPVNEETVISATAMADLKGEPAFYLLLRGERDIVQRGKEALFKHHAALALSGIIFVGVLGLFVERRVLSRLAGLRWQVEGIGGSGKALGRVHMPGGDELSALAGRINGMLDEIESSRADLRRRFAENQEQKAYLRRILDSIQAGVILVDPETHLVVEVNAFAASSVGRPKEDIIGQPCHGIVCPAQKGRCPVTDLGQGGEQSVRKLVRADGSTIAVLKTVSCITRENKELLLETFTEVESLTRAQAALERSEEVYRTLFMNTGTATVLIAEDTTITLANQEFEKLCGYTRAEIEGRMSWTEFFAQTDVDWMLRHHVKRRESPELAPRNFEARFVTREGEQRIVWLTVALLPGMETSVAALEDITDRKRAEEQLRHQAFHDSLTGLPNRVLLLDRMARVFETARRDRVQAGVLLMDLDRFKDVNDTLGHSQGDELLRLVAERLSASVRRVDTVARLGGDEFVIVVDCPATPDGMALVGRHVQQAMDESFELAGGPVHIGISIGMALYPDHGHTPELLLKAADLAMYRAKEQGRNTSAFYTKELNDQAVRRLQVQSWLRHAIAFGGLEVHYQPKVACPGGRITGAEALVRLRREDGTLVPPVDFIAIAEETGLIMPLADFVLETASRQAMLWRGAGHKDFVMAVNLSPRQFTQADLAERIGEILARTGCAAEALEFEITENVLMGNQDEVGRTLAAINKMGATIALDDFGKEYSSLGYIKRLPIASIKIDRSFIDGVPDDDNDTAIVRSVLAMAEDLGLRVVAEGVENAEQAEYLEAQGCVEHQGYYYSRPVPAGQMDALLAAGVLPIPSG